LVQLLIKAINANQQAQQSGLPGAIIDDVPMEEIIEGTVGALHQLARDSHNGAVIRDLKCIPVLVQLLYMSWDGIQRVACGCLSELATDKQNAELIENENITDRLTELLRSKDHAISTYAAAVLFRLSEETSNGAAGLSTTTRQQVDMMMLNNNLAHTTSNLGSNDQYVAYNTIDPYEIEMQHGGPNGAGGGNGNYGDLSSVQQQQQSMQQQPATWFDTDL
jgi:hypothetical protein